MYTRGGPVIGKSLLFLTRYMGGLLEEAPTELPLCIGLFHDLLIVVCFPMCLDFPAIGEQRFFEVPSDILDRVV